MTDKTRRNPQQARAEATVQAIFEATFQLLEAHGVDKLSTNHIAARAGVSIGTLYQYFGSKQDILAGLAQQRAEATRNEIAATIIERPDLGSIRSIVRALTRSFRGSPATRRALLDALLDRGGDGVFMAHHEAFLASISGKARLQIELTPESAFVLTHAVPGLLRAAAAEAATSLDPDALEEELVRLMEAYVGALMARRVSTQAN